MERKVLVDLSGLFMVLSLCMGINGQSKAAIFIAIGLLIGSNWCMVKNLTTIKLAGKVALSVFGISLISYYLLFNEWIIVLALLVGMHSYVWIIFWLNARKDRVLRVALMQVAEIGVVVTFIFALMAWFLPVTDFYFYQYSFNVIKIRLASILFIVYIFGLNNLLYLTHRKQMLSTLSKKIKPYNG